MKKIILVLTLLFSLTAYAQCNTHTIINENGDMIVCTTCCTNGNCNTFCM